MKNCIDGKFYSLTNKTLVVLYMYFAKRMLGSRAGELALVVLRVHAPYNLVVETWNAIQVCDQIRYIPSKLYTSTNKKSIFFLLVCICI